MRRNLTRISVLLILLTSSCSTLELDRSSLYTGLITGVSFEMFGSVILTRVAIDDSHPLTFIFDTGAGGTVVNTRIASQLGIAGEDTLSAQGATGYATIARSKQHTVQFGDLTLRNVMLAIALLDHLERHLGLRIDGIVGWLRLSQFAVRVDYDTKLIEIFNSGRFTYDLGFDGHDLTVLGRTLCIDATVTLGNGESYTGEVVVDTGGGGNFFFSTPFAQEIDLLRKTGSSMEREIMSLSTDPAFSHIFMLRNLSVGRYMLNDLPGVITFAGEGLLSAPRLMGVLGNGVLKRFNMFIDLESERLFLESNHLFGEPFKHDCSGLELVMDDALERVNVDRIQKGSPAQEAGVEAGDEIVRIGSRFASDLTLPEIRDLLKESGWKIEIVIERGGESRVCVVELRSLIG